MHIIRKAVAARHALRNTIQRGLLQRGLLQRGLRGSFAGLIAAGIGATAACSDINTDPKVVASIALDSIAAPSIIAGDTLRDSLGVVRPLHATAYNLQGTALTGVSIRFRSPDRRVTVDSITGIVTADSIRPTPVRVLAQAGGLQTALDSLYVIPSPDSVVVTNPRDSLVYSVRDTTPVVSNALSVRVVHLTTPTTLDAVQHYLVSYSISYPADTLLVQLVGDDAARRSRIDTTDTDGSAGRRIRLRPIRIMSQTDSVVVAATVRYRGLPIAGSPVRFVLQVKPRS